MSYSFPKLINIQYGEEIASLCLQAIPAKRIKAHDALHHKYFADLPSKIFELSPRESLFDINLCNDY